MYDTIIIGAGMSGLAAGIRLAHYDRRVCVLERHTTIGGLNSFYRLDGRNFDVGLHAVTNYAPRGDRKGPLGKLLRQLRFSWDELALAPQWGSRIAFGGLSLRFANGLELLESEIARAFPKQIDGFRRLAAAVADYDDLNFDEGHRSAREAIAAYLTDPLLVDMLLCPLMFYGSAREGDMDFAQFSILFRSMYVEGLGRPLAGIRLLLKLLVRRFREAGGELRLRAGVERIVVEDGRAVGVVLQDGTRLEARRVLSSAGWLETMRLCSACPVVAPDAAGQLSFVETVSVLDRQPSDLGYRDTMVFFNAAESFAWRRPVGLVDPASGVICSPNNFAYGEPSGEGQMRVTCLANYAGWESLPEPEYRREKLRWYDEITAAATRFVPDFRRAVVATDTFTPKTIRRFTGHENGAVYGAPQKRYDGRTPVPNLFLCGTDQGFVGIVGAIISGITMANRHLLRDG